MTATGRLRLFEAYGIELEYMIVDHETLDVKPITDQVLYELAGSYVNEIGRGAVAWSNELALHVIELKTNGPAESLSNLHNVFQREVQEVNRRLESHGAMLMPAAMHPWMNPYTEMRLWPHEYNPIYEAYNRIFDCRGHGWANLQSTHINLPFANDKEFEKLHAAVRILLPLLPALAASSPIADMERKSHLDFRLEVYRTNSRRIPSVTGYIVPERVFSQQAYDKEIFQPMYRAISPLDPDGILQDEWLNSRGAIARFDRGSIEIRVLDVQECPLADLAIVRMVTDTLKALTEERWGSLQEQKSWNERVLYELLLRVMKGAACASIDDSGYCSQFGLDPTGATTAGEIWQCLFSQLYDKKQVAEDSVLKALQFILRHGTLSQRICGALPDDFAKDDLVITYRELCECLASGKLFRVHE
jgi:carboxylate-amine ligase